MPKAHGDSPRARSGIGREKGAAALNDYMQLKNVTMKLI